MNERLTRLFIIVVVAGLVAGVFKFALVQAKNGPGSILKPMGAAVENFGEKVLGMAVKNLPQAPNLDEIDEEKKDGSLDSEPIMQPAQDIQEQTQILIESIKHLPDDQIEAIRKQVYKEFCQGLLKGE